MPEPVTFVVVPTFCEKDKIFSLLRCFAEVRALRLKIIVVNGKPGDETSALLHDVNDNRVVEILGHAGLFWSGLVNLGMQHIMHHERNQEFIVLMNADVEFAHDMLPRLVAKARAIRNAQLSAVTISNQRVVSSGVKVGSWCLTVNRHPLAGLKADSLPQDELIPVDFLPARCTLIPFAAIRKAGLIAEKALPHYCGDYEYTNRVRKLGWKPLIYTGSRVVLDSQHTGSNVFCISLPLAARIRTCFSIKSSSNPYYRLRFIWLAYPPYAKPSAMLLYAARSLLEVLLGGPAIKSVFARRESGFSGL